MRAISIRRTHSPSTDNCGRLFRSECAGGQRGGRSR
jgi:hypothetical protein